MKRARWYLMILVIVGLVFTGCQKEGPPGPVGPQGQQGPAGNANVRAYVTTVYSNDWTAIGEYGVFGYGFQVNLDVPDLIPDIVDFGTVLVYIKEGNTYFSLPSTYLQILEDGYAYKSHYWTAYTDYTVSITTQDDDGLTMVPNTMEFKIVLIDGVIPGFKSTDNIPYEVVKEFYGLE